MCRSSRYALKKPAAHSSCDRESYFQPRRCLLYTSIARELLRNAFRHARAHEIEVEIRYQDDVFRLIVRDDGKGMDPKILQDGGRPGHWGLPGVQERASGIGARLEFLSEAGAGTEVRLTLPAAIAYEKSRSGPRFRLLPKRRVHEHQS